MLAGGTTSEPFGIPSAVSDSRRIEANRRNAKRSTGPRTKDGKSRSSRNAAKHGLLAQSPIFDEDPQEFIAFAERLSGQLAPEGPVEEALVNQIVDFLWRLKRVPRIEAALLNHSDYRLRSQEAEANVNRLEREASREMVGREQAALFRLTYEARLSQKADEQFAAGTADEWMEARREVAEIREELRLPPHRLAASYANTNAQLSTLDRHETNLFRKLMTAQHELERLQAQRGATRLPPAAPQ